MPISDEQIEREMAEHGLRYDQALRRIGDRRILAARNGRERQATNWIK